MSLNDLAEWTEPAPVRLVYNGSDRTRRKPSIAPRSCGALAALPEGTLIEVELRLRDCDDAEPIYCEARRNSHYFFLRQTRLPEDWPEPSAPDAYEVRFRVIGYDDPAAPGKTLRLPERSEPEPEADAAAA